MRWMRWAVALAVMVCAGSAQAQMGMDYLSRPTFAKVFHPTVGKGAEYEMTHKTAGDAKMTTMDIGVLGKENSPTGDAYWIQTVMTSDKAQAVVGKMLMAFSPELKIQRMIVQQPGQPAMEMPMNFGGQRQSKIEDSLNEWHSAGTETITVPAGTFNCEHWKNDKNGGEVWTSEKVPAYGMVKMVSKDSTMVLMKVLDNYPDRITGPVKKFDVQEMMQQMQHQNPQKP